MLQSSWISVPYPYLHGKPCAPVGPPNWIKMSHLAAGTSMEFFQKKIFCNLIHFSFSILPLKIVKGPQLVCACSF